MKRRNFLSTTGKGIALSALATGISGVRMNAMSASPVLQQMSKLSADSDRVLVLVQLTGGNDGLNTLVPIENQRYYDGRKNIAIAKNQTLALNAGLGWHPSMSGFKQLFDSGKMTIVQGVTYPNPDRSHFRGTDIWLTATDADVFKDTGWVGRYLQTLAPGFPETMPSEPLAVQIGTSLSLGFRSDKGSLGITFRDPESFSALVEGTGAGQYDKSPSTLGGEELDFIRTVERASSVYSKAVKAAADRVKQNAVQYPNGNSLAQSLRIVARLIAGGLKTKFYLVNIGGNSFDTHFDQGGATGAHANLLQQVGDAIKIFTDDCDKLGIGKRVAGMTFSEFGRRVAENGSRGTDHGTAAPLFVFGNDIIGGKIHGKDPDLVNLDNRGDLLMEYDYRQIYSASLLQWFGVSSSSTAQALFRDFSALPLFTTPSSVEDESVLAFSESMVVQPNPSSDVSVIGYTLPFAGDVRVSLHDIRGGTVATVLSEYKQAGSHTTVANVSSLPSGVYFVKIQCGRLQSMKALHVIR
jgi:uncharacterized protein (DUF1501 family)